MVSRLKTICNLLGIKGYKIRQIYKILGIAKTCDAFYSLLRKENINPVFGLNNIK